MNTPQAQPLLVTMLVIIALFTASQLAAYFQSLINVKMLENISLDLSSTVWKHFSKLEWQAFHEKDRSYFFDLMMMDFWRVRQGILQFVELVIVNLLVILALLVFLAVVNFPIFLLCAVGMLLMALLSVVTSMKAKPYQHRFQQAWRQQHRWVASLLDKFELFKLDRGQTETTEQHKRQTSAFLKTNTAMQKQVVFWKSMMALAGNLLRLAIFVIGIHWIQQGDISLQEVVFILLLISIIQNNITQVSGAIFSIMDAQEAGESINNFLMLPAEDLKEKTGIVGPAIKNISLKEIAFEYPGKRIFGGLDIHLEKGRIYLWKGANGKGKTTLARILLGHLQPQAGSLMINGKPAEWEFLRENRHVFAAVDQHAPLFSGSIKENVLFGHPEPEEAWGLLQERFTSRLLPAAKSPESFLLGERGEGISGGEARRLAFLRELIRESELFILDEPANHLDSLSIEMMIKELDNLKKDKIVVIISHQDDFDHLADEVRHF
jgi:ATP-binding cassette subfamily C protein